MSYIQKSRRFSFPKLRRRAKKVMRKKHKKTIKLSDLDKVWNDYVQFGILKPLLKYGHIQIDDHLSFELVGRKIINDSRIYGLMTNGKMIHSKGGITEIKSLSKHRKGIVYKIVAKDTRYKGELIFEADANFSRKVKEHLINSHQYYKVVA